MIMDNIVVNKTEYSLEEDYNIGNNNTLVIFFQGKRYIGKAIQKEVPKEKERKYPLFTTADEVDIYEDCHYYLIEQAFGITCCVASKGGYYPKSYADRCFFSEKNAKDWLLLNQPILSLNDLLSVWDPGIGYDKEYYKDSSLFLRFKEFAAKKINQ